MYESIVKKSELLCGPACVNYVCNSILNLEVNVPNNLSWITDIAKFFQSNLHLEIDLTCYNSNLYDDYMLLSAKGDFEGFKSIDEFLSNGGSICEKKLSEKTLTSISKGNIIIACVSSKVFNNDKKLTGGHFIVILGSLDNEFIIANPKKKTIDVETVSKKHILNSTKKFGSWILAIKR